MRFVQVFMGTKRTTVKGSAVLTTSSDFIESMRDKGLSHAPMAAPASVMPQTSRSTAEPPALIIYLRDMAGGRSQNAR